ncbi:MAG: OmpA family protein [Bacteroidales bacterium]|nr:OmpA family protein [Bacteroidales bacterium]MDD4216534.1 OmpA family protein [Bacteroidales bacterium]MDY0141444.1 OmpA family protein [Bacteroidales bacterium]
MIISNYRKSLINNLKIILVLIIIITFSPNAYAQKNNSEAATIEGIITDFNNNIKIGETIIFENSATNKVYMAVSKDNGKFSVKLPYQNEYTIKIKGFNDEQYYTNFSIPALEKNQTELYFDIDIQIELPKLFTLDNVYFDTGKSTLKPSSYEELNNLYKYLSLKKTTVVEIAGHTDDIGSDELNMTLSQNRANSVRNYLIKKGISPDRIIAKGYGETQPIAINDSDENRAKNRRTEVRLIKE